MSGPQHSTAQHILLFCCEWQGQAVVREGQAVLREGQAVVREGQAVEREGQAVVREGQAVQSGRARLW